MLAKRRQFTLPGNPEMHAVVNVIPTGLLTVEIEEEHRSIDAEFEHIAFKVHDGMTDLVCYGDSGKTECWNLGLYNEDARELARLIEYAEEELEILLRDL
ncbi:hypothetical protein [Thaumasiovibrio sp. DFM-14]|uniref:hypothetical protein n=1 Tax=Thaumasiovibrio sp. DFM-14 TaxID=3384792 RepID=UPI00399FECA6